MPGDMHKAMPGLIHNLFVVSSYGQRGQGAVWNLFYKSLFRVSFDLTQCDAISWPNNLLEAPSLHTLGIKFQHMNLDSWGGQKYSVFSIVTKEYCMTSFPYYSTETDAMQRERNTGNLQGLSFSLRSSSAALILL